MKSRWKFKIGWSGLAVACFFLLAAPAWATSNRLVGEEGYAAQDYTMDDPGDRTYSGGLDVVYSQLAEGTDAAKTRCYLKCEDNVFDAGGVIRVRLYDYTGKLVDTVAEVTGLDYATSQGVKLSPDGTELWFSFTSSYGTPSGDGWYKVNTDFDTNNFGIPQFQFSQAAAWEMEWCAAGPQDGVAFFAGKDSDPWNDPHAIYARSNSSWQMVVDVGGYSNGFAFDKNGNLWTGSYTTSGPADQQYIYVFAAGDVNSAVTGGYELTPGDAAKTIECPSITVGEDTYYTGPNDFECDPDGNVYVSLNGGFEQPANTEVGYIVKLPYEEDEQGQQIWPDESDMVTLAKTNPTLGWDWMKAMSYDGATNLDDGGHSDPTQDVVGNCLFVDQDFSFGAGGPDQVTGVTIDADADNDGVPDAVDNAYLTDNPDQVDTDQDMYGNMCDGDFNNDSNVNMQDFTLFKGEWLQPESNPNMDMNWDSNVNMQDFTLFKNRWLKSAPWY